jgi:dTDP-4-dehydrorhamnose reductase
VRETIERVGPAAIVHTAYRQDGEGARETTVGGAEAVAAAAHAVGARLVHLSSDVIFDGTKPGPYTEDDPPSPITDYGRAKADAERLVAAAHPEAVLVRTSLIYGGDGESRHEKLAQEAARGDGKLGFFDDELRCPVLVADLAAALLELVDRPERGVLNVAGSEVVTRYEFACLVAAAAGLGADAIRRTSIAEAGLERPRNCALDTGRARGLLRTPLHGAREGVGGGPG